MNILYDYAMKFVGQPYIWGGEHPSLGFDCSGLTQEILRSVGLDPPGDQNAQALYNHFEKIGAVNSYGLGALAFFGKSVTSITHVGFCLDNYRMLEARGGDSTTLTKEIAIKQGAFVGVRLIKRRGDLVAVIKPRYFTIGCI
jgi:cell wall-associated NlpC family hydrolase